MNNSEFPPLKHPFRVFFRFLKYLAPYWDKVLFIILGIMIAAPMGNIQMVISKAIIDQAVLNLNESIGHRLSLMFLFTGLAALLLWSGQLIERLRGFMGFYVRMFVTLNLRRKFYSHLHRLPYEFFQNRPIGEHMYRCMNDVSSEVWTSRGIVDMITTNIPDIFRILNDMFWQGMIVFVLNPMAAFFIGITIIPYTVLSYWMNTRIKRAFFRLKKEEQAVPAVLRDMIAGVETVKSYGRRRYMNIRYVRQLISSIRATLRRDYLQVALDQFVFWALDLIAIGGLWIYLVYQLMIGEITVGSFYVLLNVSVRFIGPFKQLINQCMNIRQQLVPTQRVLETLDVEPAIQDFPDAAQLGSVKGRIRFQNVSFAYNPEVPVLRNVSFDVKTGQTLGIVGRSGAGKTTILNLLMRLYRPSSGSILIDEYDLDRIRLDDWRKCVGVVLQNTFIFGGDVAYNVRYGNLEASMSQIREALALADAERFVAEMPQGLYTDLSEGSKLSGGQKQRLGIARALARQPKILILDEPTSSLDSRTENDIWRSFEKAIKGVTAIIVSHRLFTVRKADHIIVLDKGEIVEQGSHDDLLRLGGLYAEMWKDQTGAARE